MISVDTNVLVRILINDESQAWQVKAAREYAKKAKRVFVTQPVQLELVWVLESAYEFSKDDIILLLNYLYENDAYVIQHEDQFITAFNLYRHHPADFADCLILAESLKDSNKVVTFDKGFARLDHVDLLHPKATVN